MSDRIFALVWLAVCTVVAIQIINLHVPIAYDPVGPRAYPLLLIAVMVVCCLALIFRPDPDVRWPAWRVLGKGALLVGVLLVYGSIFEIVGAPLATALMVLALSRLFGASWLFAFITALLVAMLGYLLFDRLLDVNLPLGRIWQPA